MKLVLKGYSQDVALLDAKNAKYMLNFLDEDSGHEIRIPVPAETIQELAEKAVLLEMGKVAAAGPTPAEIDLPPSDAEGLADVPEEYEDDESAVIFGSDPDETPETEEEVPSL